MLEVNGVTVRYGYGAAALDDLHVCARQGQVTAIVGGNGAGKTTLMRLLSGVLPAYGGRCLAGSASYEGRSLAGLSAAAIVKMGIAHVPEGRQVFASLTVEGNLRAGATTQRARMRDLVAEAYDRFPILAEHRRLPAGLLSGGQQQMLAIARGLMSAPRLLLLDEPTLGLAPIVVDQIGATLSELRQNGTSIVLVEQNAAMALRVADHGYVLDQGSATLGGRADALRDDPSVKDRYLGGRLDERAVFDVDRCRIGRWIA